MRWLERIQHGPDPEAPDDAPVVLVVAHPDDETIGVGGQLPHLRPSRVVVVTDGSPPDPADAVAAGFATGEEYACARREELIAALGRAGLGSDLVRWLGHGDQAASFHLAELARQVADVLAEFDAPLVLTHPYEGGHPDHDATAFAVAAAVRAPAVRRRMPPVVVEMASYHAGPGFFVAGEFLPAEGTEVAIQQLTEEQRRFKCGLYACHATQRRVLEAFPIAVERFRLAPRHDFSRPPHPGRLHYEHYAWGVTGEVWRGLASRALRELEAEGWGGV